MLKIGKGVVKFRIPILIIGVLLLIPAVFGYLNTGINYDMLTYLPENMETVQGQNILKDDFGKGAFSLIVTEGMDDKSVRELTDKIKDVDHVADALSYGEVASSKIPDQAIPDELLSKFKNGDCQMVAVFFDDSTSAAATMNAVSDIRGIADEHVFVSGMSALVVDLKNLAEREEPVYVGVAVLCSIIILLLCTDCFLAPFIFLISIGMAILYNLGTNVFLGEISYITKALAAVLQLAVTMDYSIFLWSAFEENIGKYPEDGLEAMAHAIDETLTSIFSSAMTATAGFLAMIFMSYTLGADLGIVMAKGCIMGLVASVTLLPALILVFERPMLKTRHKRLIPKVDKLGNAITSRKAVAIIMIVFAIIFVPAVYGFMNKPVYYDFSNMIAGDSLDPNDIKFHTANEKLEDTFDVATTEMILCDSNMSHADAKQMLDRIGDVDGVQYALGYDSFKGGLIPNQLVPAKLDSSFKSGDNQLILINSSYQVSTDEVNAQIDQIKAIMKDYDANATLIGEAPATKDLITLTDHDFVVVDIVAVIAILIILAIVFGSASLPFILVLVIEFAIMINLGLPYYTDTQMPFIAPICISTIQLGSTVNYAILLTTRYKRNRYSLVPKREAISDAFSRTFPAVVTSALSFFAATFGVALYSNMSMISMLCSLMSRGAIVSMFAVLFLLPAFFMIFDKFIVKTSRGFKPRELKEAQNEE
jgi:predicted RND superfamily exporter protein